MAGPGDLSVSMGVAGNGRDPEVQDALLSVLATCKKFGVACGGVAETPEDVERQLEQGFQFFITSSQQSNPTLSHAHKITGR